MKVTYTLQAEPSADERNRITDVLIAYNEGKAGPRNKKEFRFSVHSETGEFVGGSLGFTHWNHFFVSAVFVDQQLRRGGIGRELLARAEALAPPSHFVSLPMYSSPRRGALLRVS